MMTGVTHLRIQFGWSSNENKNIEVACINEMIQNVTKAANRNIFGCNYNYLIGI
jgi:hypothetical protein